MSIMPSTFSASFSLESDSPLYSRFSVDRENPPLRGHAIVFHESRDLTFHVSVPSNVLDFDFENQSSRPDVGRQKHVPRPGLYLSSVARVFKDCFGSSYILFNANNIGYWANQFAIIQGELIYKSKTPLFFDPSQDVGGSYSFFLQGYDTTLRVEELKIRSEGPLLGERKYHLALDTQSTDIAKTAVSGYPLIRNGVEVWRNELQQAWDPKLIYYVGDPTNMRRGDILDRLYVADAQNQEIMCHGMTVLGITENGVPCLFVAEESAKASCGVSLREAAQVMTSLECRDAIVLGAKGDAQLVSTLEGVIARPLISPHDMYSARPVDNLGYGSNLGSTDYLERPVPGICALGIGSSS